MVSENIGPRASLHLVLADYLLEVVPSGAYYPSSSDSLEGWSVGLDTRVNVPALGGLRPYIGAGVHRLHLFGGSEWFGVANAGLYLRLIGDRVVPFGEASYFPAFDDKPFRFQAGLRFILKER